MKKSVGKTHLTRILVMMLALFVGTAFSLGVTSAEADAAVKVPAKVKNTEAINKTHSTVKLQWKKQGKVSGVQVKYIVKYKEASAVKWDTRKTKKNTLKLKSLKPGVSYKIKVQGYIKKNGTTYKGAFGKTITVKTNKATISVGDKKIEIADGQTISIPSPSGSKGYTVKDVVIESDKRGNLTITGTTTDGLNYYCGTEGDTIDFLSVGDDWKYSGVNRGGRSLEVEGANGATVYWTVDGTEPKVGQEELKGKCRYTRNTYGYYMKALTWEGFSPDPLEDGYFETTLRGVTKPGEKDIMLKGDDSLDDERIRWFKAYKNGKLVAEYFQRYNIGGWETTKEDYNQMKQVCRDAIDELDRFDEEYWGPGPL